MAAEVVLGFGFEGGAFLKHFLDGTLQLTVVTVEIILRGVVDYDIGIERGVLAIVSTHVDTSYLWDTEHDTVDECLPPYAGRGASYRCADEFANLHILKLAGEAAAVVALVYNHGLVFAVIFVEQFLVELTELGSRGRTVHVIPFIRHPISRRLAMVAFS